MKKVLPWVGLGLLAAALGGTTFGCSNSKGGGGGGTGGGGILDGGGAAGMGATAGVGANGGGGNGGGGATDSGATSATLGATCTTDADCDTGLTCYTPDSTDFGTGGPAQGYCSKPCTQNSDCTSVDFTSQCVNMGSGKAFCLEGCDPTASTTCQGRYDSLCLPLQATDADGGIIDSGTPIYACLPYCATDNDCGGQKCDLSSGLCMASPKSGDPVGTPCDPSAAQDSGTDPCQGFCIGFQGQANNVGSCTAFCGAPIGLVGACGSNPAQGSKQAAACIYQASFSNSSATVGICGQLCNCDSDCMGSNMVCESWATAGASNPSQFVSALGQAGLCVSSTDSEGGAVTGIPNCPGGNDSGADTGSGGSDSGTDSGTADSGTDAASDATGG